MLYKNFRAGWLKKLKTIFYIILFILLNIFYTQNTFFLSIFNSIHSAYIIILRSEESIKNFIHSVTSAKEIIEQNNEYKKIIEQQKKYIRHYEDYLTIKHKMINDLHLNGCIGNVVYRNFGSKKSIFISLMNTECNINKNAAVISEDGFLIGKVIKKIDKNIAEIQLITSDRFYIPVITSESKIFGVLNGNSMGNDILKMHNAGDDFTKIMTGETIVTSGENALTPSGIQVGIVMSKNRNSAKIRIFQDRLYNTDKVFILNTDPHF